MKKLHSHHTKKKSAKNHSSRAKDRKQSALTERIVKVHTRTKAAKTQKKIEDLRLAALKLPNKKFYTKSDIKKSLMNDHSQIPTHQIKLILNKVNLLKESEISKYQEQGLTLSNFIEKIISNGE